MTNEYFECSVSYEKMMDNGIEKRVKEMYLVEAVSFANAESRFLEEITPFMTGEFEVAAVNKRKYLEIFENTELSADRYYKVKASFITLDEKSGNEKEKSYLYLVQAADIHQALDKFDEGMKGSMMDYTIKAVTETPYLDLYHLNND